MTDQSFHGTGISFNWLERRISASSEIRDLLNGQDWQDVIAGLLSARVTNTVLENDTQRHAYALEMTRISSEMMMRAMLSLVR